MHQGKPWQPPVDTFVADASAMERVDFLHRTYQHLALAIAAFVGLEAVLLNLPGIDRLVGLMLGTRFSWLIVLGLFMVVSRVASRWAQSATSSAIQYVGLGVYVVAEAIIFVPLLYFAINFAGEDVVPKAAILTGVVFGGLTAYVMITKKDLSFLGGFLVAGGFTALGIIVVSAIFGFGLGTWFAAAMVIFAAGAILYETSNMLHVYRTDQHVAAALGLFASVALLFWYVLSLMSSDD